MLVSDGPVGYSSASRSTVRDQSEPAYLKYVRLCTSVRCRRGGRRPGGMHPDNPFHAECGVDTDFGGNFMFGAATQKAAVTHVRPSVASRTTRISTG